MSLFTTSRYYNDGVKTVSWREVYHRYTSLTQFDYIQTFYVNPEAMNNAGSALITSVDLYFKSKPNATNNVSGTTNPGITVSICEVENEKPKLDRIIEASITQVAYGRINTSGNAETATTVAFTNPVRLETGRFYGIVIKYLDPAFQIWENVQGHRLVFPTGTSETPSPGSLNRFDGRLYKENNVDQYDPNWQSDLKFAVRIARFNTGTASNTTVTQTFNLVNKPYEFITYTGRVGGFQGGEFVYKSNQANEAGTVNIATNRKIVTGTGTNFTADHLGLYAVFEDGTNRDIVQVVSVTNTTQLILDRYPDFSNTAATYKLPPVGRVASYNPTANLLYLKDSNAENTTFRFAASDTIVGNKTGASATIASLDRLVVDKFQPNFLIGNPATSSFTASYALTNEANNVAAFETTLQNGKENQTEYKGYILSRSQEVIETGMFGSSNRSAYANITFSVTTGGANSYSVPFINASEINFDSIENVINSNTLATVDGIANYDTEVDRNGLGKTKHITRKVIFGENRYAEDIVVYLTAYRPANTEIKVYAKIHNSADKDAFDDKAWSPLVLKDNADVYSTSNRDDLVEYTFGLPQFPEVHYRLDGINITSQGSGLISATVDHSANVSSGDLVVLSSPLFPENNEVFVVASANSTAISLTREVTNVNVVGQVNVDKLKYKTTAWNNAANDNVARYVTASQAEFDAFNTMQLKIVLLSTDTNIVPEVDQLQVIGVSS